MSRPLRCACTVSLLRVEGGKLGVKWEREVLVVPTRLLLNRGRRGDGRDRCEVPAKRAGLLRACPQRELMEREYEHHVGCGMRPAPVRGTCTASVL